MSQNANLRKMQIYFNFPYGLISCDDLQNKKSRAMLFVTEAIISNAKIMHEKGIKQPKLFKNI